MVGSAHPTRKRLRLMQVSDGIGLLPTPVGGRCPEDGWGRRVGRALHAGRPSDAGRENRWAVPTLQNFFAYSLVKKFSVADARLAIFAEFRFSGSFFGARSRYEKRGGPRASRSRLRRASPMAQCSPRSRNPAPHTDVNEPE